MSQTKDAFIRYRILDKCFRSINRYGINDLKDKCNEKLKYSGFGLNKGVSQRTIYNDIEYMKSVEGWNAPIIRIRDGYQRYYTYSDRSFSIDKMPLNEAQIKQIQYAYDILDNCEGLPLFRDMGDSLEKIGLIANNNNTEPCFEFEHNEYVEGLQYLKTLFKAIKNCTVLKIVYEPFGSVAREYNIHPQFLKQHSSRWYIFGKEQEHPGQVWNLALDRIKSIKPTKQYKYEKLDIDWKEYFEDIVGVTNILDDPTEKVHFIVHGKTAHYINGKPIHGSQRQKWIGENDLDVELNVKINYEFKQLLLSYASSITLLSPKHLVEEHKESLRKALEQY